MRQSTAIKITAIRVLHLIIMTTLPRFVLNILETYTLQTGTSKVDRSEMKRILRLEVFETTATFGMTEHQFVKKHDLLAIILILQLILGLAKLLKRYENHALLIVQNETVLILLKIVFHVRRDIIFRLLIQQTILASEYKGHQALTSHLISLSQTIQLTSQVAQLRLERSLHHSSIFRMQSTTPMIQQQLTIYQ